MLLKKVAFQIERKLILVPVEMSKSYMDISVFNKFFLIMKKKKINLILIFDAQHIPLMRRMEGFSNEKSIDKLSTKRYLHGCANIACMRWHNFWFLSLILSLYRSYFAMLFLFFLQTILNKAKGEKREKIIFFLS